MSRCIMNYGIVMKQAPGLVVLLIPLYGLRVESKRFECLWRLAMEVLRRTKGF